ncbi:hypothetical protein LTR20_003377 [Exophiala xenobiotica]|nr:hypothetical protein LTS13_009205 [Exophiala xenobiotica]KAK5402642.1 hypothetical protein LTR79_001370 [Exophiala xenobiotica]KAK5418943.1 hypothetical protein LTR90_004006 [Exophiala xenobiotica]KAK5435998.1 hypothetical protein LTR18_009577 [Exophiala xenobiotica]KAK5466430.1 hypothetical protein LTR20_003377 [Exophiala xenobiotica]
MCLFRCLTFKAIMAQLNPSSSTSGFFQALPIVPPQYTAPSDSSSSTSSPPSITDDPVFARVLSLHLPSPIPSEISKHLHDFSRLALSPSTLQHTVDCETNQPTLHPLTTFGEENKTSPLRTSEGWRALKRIQTAAGVVGYGYPHYTIHSTTFNRRIHQFATLHLWHGTAALATCPMAMTDGAAVLLRRHLSDPDNDAGADQNQPGRADVFLESYHRLISLDPAYAWTSGQWMTERTGGSDVSGTETVARRMTPAEIESDINSNRDKDAHGLPLGPWTVSGFKWFSSATDADMAILLAQTDKGLSAFYAPLRRRVGQAHLHSHSPSSAAASRIKTGTETETETEMNGIRPTRLKSKLGTRGLPTAELEIRGMRAYLIGREGQGVKEISSILNITRLHTASAAAGYLARGLAVSRAYTRVRRVRGGLLSDNAQHLSWMAGETVKYAANTHLVFLGVALLGASERASEQGQQHDDAAGSTNVLIPREKSRIDVLLRILTPVMKARVSLNSVSGLRECMESLGGVGYCENNEDGGVMNLARLFRDSVVGTIWEGTTSVMAEDVLRVVKKNQKAKGDDILDKVFGSWTRAVLQAVAVGGATATGRPVTFKFEPEYCQVVLNRYNVLRDTVDKLAIQELLRRGREILEHIEAVACACLLMYDACTDGDEVAAEVARRWVRSIALPPDVVRLQGIDGDGVWQKDVEMEERIFLGADTASSTSIPPAQARL